jgi:hypothetical protein
VTVTVLMISSADHIAGKTGLSGGLTVYASKAGGAPAAITPTVTELDATNMPGLYSLALTTTHTNTLGELAIRVSGSGADPTDVKWQISARLNDDLTYPTISGRSLAVDATGLADANVVKVGPSGAGTAQTARDIGASVLLSSGTGAGQISLSSGLVTLAPVTHTGATIPTVATLTGHTAQTGDAFARLGAPAGASVSADVAAVNARATDIQARLPAALVSGKIDASVSALASGLDLTATMKASVNAEADAALSDVGLTTTITGRIDAAVSTRLSAAGYTAPDNATINAIAGYVDTEVASIKAVTDKLDTTLEADGGVYRLTANALEQAPTGGGASAATIAAAVWDEAISDHLGAGSAGASLNAAGSAGDPWTTTLPGSYSAGQAGHIIGTNLNATISSRLASGGYTAPLDASGTRSALGLAAANLDTQLSAISSKTTNLPSDPADASDIAASFSTVNSSLSTIAGYIDTEVSAIKAKTDLIPTSPAATGDVPSAAANAAALLGTAVEGSVTVVQSLRLANAALGGKASGLDTTNPKYRDLADTKDRLDAVVDANGNRTAVTRDLS